MPENLRHTLNWVEPVFAKIQKEYKDKCANGLKEWYPRIVLKVPTGGGKTLLAVEAIREYQNLFAQKRTGLGCLDRADGNDLHANDPEAPGQGQLSSSAT